MKKILEEMLTEYQVKFTAYLKAAELIEQFDKDIFDRLITKASGCKLMIEEYQRQLSNLK